MLVYFQTYSNQSVAINPSHVILVTETKGRSTVKVTLVDGGTTEVIGTILEVVSKLNVV